MILNKLEVNEIMECLSFVQRNCAILESEHGCVFDCDLLNNIVYELEQVNMGSNYIKIEDGVIA